MTNPMDLTGQTILVTGASSGIGRAAAILLSKLGARLALAARNRERLEQTACMLEGSGHLVEPLDLTSTWDLRPWLKELAARIGRFSGLVHCAGVVALRPLQFLSPHDVDTVMRVNFEAAIYLAQAFRQKPVHAQESSIVFVASVAGITGEGGLAPYCASKGAVLALTRSLAVELAQEKIRVNAVAPGLVRTNLEGYSQGALPAGHYAAVAGKHLLGLGEPEDVAGSIAFLLARTGRWITGSTLIVDGGYTAH